MQSESEKEKINVKEKSATDLIIQVEQPYDLKELRKDCFQLTVVN